VGQGRASVPSALVPWRTAAMGVARTAPATCPANSPARDPPPGGGTAGSGRSGSCSAVRLCSRIISWTAPSPSVTLWWLFATYPARPSPSPSTSSACHSGRSRSSGAAAKSCTTSSSCRSVPGAGSPIRCTCRDRSKSPSVTQAGVPSASAGSSTRCRIRGTMRDAHSCAASSRSQSGAGSSSSSRLTVTRSRGSADSARHMAVSSGFIRGEAPQSSGGAGGGPELAVVVAVTCPVPWAGQLASVARYCPRTAWMCSSRPAASQPSVATGGSTAICTVPA